jgi:hypothetical protein
LLFASLAIYGTHTMRRTKATVIYKRAKNLRAVQLLLGHSKLESTVRYLGIEVDDAREISEQTEIWRRRYRPHAEQLDRALTPCEYYRPVAVLRPRVFEDMTVAYCSNSGPARIPASTARTDDPAILWISLAHSCSSGPPLLAFV